MKMGATFVLAIAPEIVFAGLGGGRAQQLDPGEYVRHNPMVFFAGNGAEGSCGPGCSQRFAAEGAFDAGRISDFVTLSRSCRTPTSRFISIPAAASLAQLWPSVSCCASVG